MLISTKSQQHEFTKNQKPVVSYSTNRKSKMESLIRGKPICVFSSDIFGIYRTGWALLNSVITVLRFTSIYDGGHSALQWVETGGCWKTF